MLYHNVCGAPVHLPQTLKVQAEGTCIVQLYQGVEGASAGFAVAAQSEGEAWGKGWHADVFW